MKTKIQRYNKLLKKMSLIHINITIYYGIMLYLFYNKFNDLFFFYKKYSLIIDTITSTLYGLIYLTDYIFKINIDFIFKWLINNLFYILIGILIRYLKTEFNKIIQKNKKEKD